jgi:C1A family cysteine protease
MTAHPIETEAEYPYTAKDGTCQASGSGQKIHGFFDLPAGDANQLHAGIYKSPTSVAIEADQFAFQAYKSGVITTGCGQNLDHGVLAVGYGTENGVDYFLVKNSWGSSWGDQGYVKIGASADNVCGILSMASLPMSQC